MALSDYLNDASVLLNDQNYSFTSKTQLTRWVNEARSNCAKRTGCVRRLVAGQSAFGASAQPGHAIPGAAQPGALPDAFSNPATPPQSAAAVQGATQNWMRVIPGVERYPYEGFFNPVLQAQHAGTYKILDVIACSVNWGGVSRPSLDWWPWDELQAYARAYAVLNTSFPSIWSCYNDGGQGEIWMFPVPSQSGEIELDVFASPKPLYTDSDFDVIPDGFREAIKFGAAKYAFMSSGRYANAQVMEDQFADNIGVARVAVDRGKTRSYYYSVP
jgi:hypothetical protein